MGTMQFMLSRSLLRMFWKQVSTQTFALQEDKGNIGIYQILQRQEEKKGGEPGEGFIGEAVLYQDVKNEHRCLPGGHSKRRQSTKARRHEALKENQ